MTSQPYNATSSKQAKMNAQRFCLRWNNHQSNLLSVFDQLLHDESFVDVTLAVEGQLLRAHKMVLSACSPYFQALFVNHPDKHPIVILKDVPYSDMKSLLDFMYRGEVSVDQERLTAFLRVAECLRIKGLTEVNEEKCDSITSSLQQNQYNLPHLQRLPQGQQFKRYSAMNILGNALQPPKRKRGRPRKLSGSSNGTPGAEDFDRGDNLVQGSPEMLEVKMGMDGFTGNNSDSSGEKPEQDNDEEVKIKYEEPIAGTSHEQNSHNSVQIPKTIETDFNISDSPITQKLLTPKSEQEEQLSPSVNSDSSYQLGTPDNINNNNTPSTSSMNSPSDDQYDYLENNQNHTNHLSASITVELIPPAKYQQESVIISTESARNMLQEPSEERNDHTYEKNMETGAGVHFLSNEDIPEALAAENGENYDKKKNELLEYLTRNDGSVVCKLCGEVLASRTHWYRHKYKIHVNSLVNPAPLFKCTHCNCFFKSRKGYMGHIATRHSDNNEQEEVNISIKEEIVESEPIPKVAKKTKDAKGADWDEQREKEEKLVADIIDRVRRECEAQGAAVTRRGYSRRSTVMMNT